MNSQSSECKGVDRPSNVALARRVAQQAAAAGGSGFTVRNYEHGCIKEVLAALQADPPRIAEALKDAEDGVAHAWRGNFEQDCPEAWACATVVSLLRAT